MRGALGGPVSPIALGWGMGHVHKMRNVFRNMVREGLDKKSGCAATGRATAPKVAAAVAAQREKWVATLPDLKGLLQELTIKGAGRLVRGAPGNMNLYNDAVLVVSFSSSHLQKSIELIHTLFFFFCNLAGRLARGCPSAPSPFL